jgi:hypothetical protein
MKLYIAVLDEVPSFMVPTLVAHSMLGAHLAFSKLPDRENYEKWLLKSFKKCVIKVNRKEYSKIALLSTYVYEGHENTTLGGEKSCAVVMPYSDDVPLPNVLKFAKLWTP